MHAMVMSLGRIPLQDRDGFGLFMLLPDGRVGMDIGTSWANAAERVAPKLQGLDVFCDPTLATVGRRFKWTSREPTSDQLLERAAVAFGFANDLSPAWHPHVIDFVRAWIVFFPLRLWEQLPAEMSLRTLLRQGDAVTEGCLAVLGQNRTEYGLAWYRDWRAFDAMWNGDPYPVNGLSVLAHNDPFLEPVFQPFGVPPVTTLGIVDSKGKRPGLDTVRLATAAMELMLDVLRDDAPRTRPAGDGLTLEFKREETSSKRPAPPKKKARKKK